MSSKLYNVLFSSSYNLSLLKEIVRFPLIYLLIDWLIICLFVNGSAGEESQGIVYATQMYWTTPSGQGQGMVSGDPRSLSPFSIRAPTSNRRERAARKPLLQCNGVNCNGYRAKWFCLRILSQGYWRRWTWKELEKLHQKFQDNCGDSFSPLRRIRKAQGPEIALLSLASLAHEVPTPQRSWDLGFTMRW